MDQGFIEKDDGFSNPATNANVVLLALSRMNSAGAAKLDFHATADFRLRSIDPCFRTLCGTTPNDDRQSIAVAVGETSSDTYWKLTFQETELAVGHEKSRGVSARDFQSIAVPVADQGLAHASESTKLTLLACTEKSVPHGMTKSLASFAIPPMKLATDQQLIPNPSGSNVLQSKLTSSPAGGV